MRALRVVTIETFTLLRRDKIFVPIAILALCVSAFANMASDWSIEEFGKVLYDVGLFGFQLMGGLVALFWGTKSVAEARQDGGLESQLAWPIGRATWILGKYLGLALALILLGVMTVAFWQGLMLLNKFGWMDGPALCAFAGVVLSWLVLGATAVFFSSFMGFALAAFVGILTWITGLISASAARTTMPETADLTRRTIQAFARVWDLNQFNLVNHVLADPLPTHELGWRAAYGIMLIFVLVTASCIIFAQRDRSL